LVLLVVVEANTGPIRTGRPVARRDTLDRDPRCGRPGVRI